MYLMKKKKGVKINYDDEPYESWQSRQVGYWRKANAIHKWFVDNVQNGEDDCGYYVVTKSNLEELRSICDRIITNTSLIPSGVTYKVYDIDKRQEVDEEQLIVDNEELCRELLPTQDGFFFGGTSYDDWYYESVQYTRDLCDKLLKEIDFNQEELEYSSSW